MTKQGTSGGRDVVMASLKWVVLLAFVAVATSAGAQVDRRDPVHNEAVALPSPMGFSHTDHYAREIPAFGEGVFHTTLKNTTGRSDTFRVSIENVIVPEGVGSFDWLAFYCDTGGACHFGESDYFLGAGESETFDVHLTDYVGNVQGMALTKLTAAWGREEVSVCFATFVGLPTVLHVDDDAGASHEFYLAEAIKDAGYEARPWDVSELGRPELEMLDSYEVVLWSTADGSAEYIDAVDEQAMMDYLDGGGNLMLASMDYLSSRTGANEFTTDYLHLIDWTSEAGDSPAVGMPGDPITDGMYIALDGGPFPVDLGDSMAPEAPALPLFTAPSAVGGVRVDESGHRLAFLGFAIENVGDTSPDPDNRATLVGRMIDWFTEPAMPRGTETRRLVLEQNAPNPFNPRTEIAFKVPEGAGNVSLSVFNVSGQVVRTLVDGVLPPGPAVAAWDGKDESGRGVASGVYLAVLQAAGESATRKMLLLK